VNTESSIDPKEKAHFEKIARLWWEPRGPFWPLHAMNALRVRYIREQLVSYYKKRDDALNLPFKGLRCLDVGCGGGILSEAIARLGGEVMGIDVVPKNISIANNHAKASGLTIAYEVTTAEDLLARDVSFDVVFNLEVVEHVAQPEGFMQSCGRLVRPGGMMVVATLNRTVLSYLAAIIGAEVILRWLPRGTHHWRKFVSPLEIERYLGSEGFTVIATTGVFVNPLTRRFSLIKSTAVNYMMVASKAPS
jgi:2-polyprenyl-6-hydroxyphenyl methylase/3-demethylubiquinone-9 3-methyltransferase